MLCFVEGAKQKETTNGLALEGLASSTIGNTSLTNSIQVLTVPLSMDLEREWINRVGKSANT